MMHDESASVYLRLTNASPTEALRLLGEITAEDGRSEPDDDGGEIYLSDGDMHIIAEALDYLADLKAAEDMPHEHVDQLLRRIETLME